MPPRRKNRTSIDLEGSHQGCSQTPQSPEGHQLWNFMGEPLRDWLEKEANLVSILEQIGKAVVEGHAGEKPRRMQCHPFVVKKRDGGSWDLGKNDLFLLPRL